MNRPLIRDTLKDLGLAPSKSRGQNFLKDARQIERVVSAILKRAGPQKIMEIGPGLGALTAPLLAAGAGITAVELDRGLAENLAAAYPDLNILHCDILTIDENDLSAISPLYLCGNLPYNISSQVLFWFLKHRRFFSGATFMLQKEMAVRLNAEVGTKDYGRLAIALSLWFNIKTELIVPPTAFHPKPKVDSAVVSLLPRPESQEPAIKPEALSRFTAAAFAARRKTIFNNLSKTYGRPRTEEALARLELAASLRAETLKPQTLAALAMVLEGDA